MWARNVHKFRYTVIARRRISKLQTSENWVIICQTISAYLLTCCVQYTHIDLSTHSYLNVSSMTHERARRVNVRWQWRPPMIYDASDKESRPMLAYWPLGIIRESMKFKVTRSTAVACKFSILFFFWLLFKFRFFWFCFDFGFAAQQRNKFDF